MRGPQRGEERGNGTVGKGSWNRGVDLPPPRITALTTLPQHIPPRAPPLPLPLLRRRDTSRGRDKNLPPRARSDRGNEAPLSGALPVARSV